MDKVRKENMGRVLEKVLILLLGFLIFLGFRYTVHKIDEQYGQNQIVYLNEQDEQSAVFGERRLVLSCKPERSFMVGSDGKTVKQVEDWTATCRLFSGGLDKPLEQTYIVSYSEHIPQSKMDSKIQSNSLVILMQGKLQAELEDLRKK